jgi:hypothetical protein
MTPTAADTVLSGFLISAIPKGDDGFLLRVWFALSFWLICQWLSVPWIFCCRDRQIVLWKIWEWEPLALQIRCCVPTIRPSVAEKSGHRPHVGGWASLCSPQLIKAPVMMTWFLVLSYPSCSTVKSPVQTCGYCSTRWSFFSSIWISSKFRIPVLYSESLNMLWKLNQAW